MAMLAIAAPSSNGRLPRSARMLNSWPKNITQNPSAPWTPQMTVVFAAEIFKEHKDRSVTVITTHFAEILRPSALFSLTWEDILFPGDFILISYGLSIECLLVRNPKTGQHIARK